jgi:hypothetical protein
MDGATNARSSAVIALRAWPYKRVGRLTAGSRSNGPAPDCLPMTEDEDFR